MRKKKDPRAQTASLEKHYTSCEGKLAMTISFSEGITTTQCFYIWNQILTCFPNHSKLSQNKKIVEANQETYLEYIIGINPNSSRVPHIL